MKRTLFYALSIAISTILFSQNALSVAPAILHEVAETKCVFQANLSEFPQDGLDYLISVYGCEKISHLKNFEIYEDEDMPRALAGSRTLKIRQDTFQKEEFDAIMVHEFAHILDLGYMRGSPESGESGFMDGSVKIYNNDGSVGFYQISWQDEKTLKESADKLDFVSGYAKSDAFEDFAESVVFYVLHNREFRIMASQNDALRKKYNFIRKEVFEGKIFYSGKSWLEVEERIWDATKA